ncbi:MAG: hypothetical protein SW019_18935 [Actinomycetota bacterium]|nr:hypothetical protein [Actinomycetota bacterium]
MKLVLVANAVSALGVAAVAALVAAAPSASADPAPAPLPPPVAPEAAPLPHAPAGPPAPLSTTSDPLAAPVAPAAEATPHLASPENLPPGTSTAPPPDTTRMGYLRDLWHAMRTQEVSGSDALLLLTQRPLNSSPSPGMPAGPQPATAPVPGAP